MFYIASKLFWILVEPLTLIGLFALAALLALILRHRRAALACLALSIGGLFLTGYTTAGALLIQPLEARFAQSAPPEAVAGIIVLGGAMDTRVSGDRDSFEFGEAADRFTEAVRLARLYPQAPIIVSGGIGALTGSGLGDAAASPAFFQAMGIDADRLVLERRARNTAQNAAYTRAMLEPEADARFLLVTSAFHMPRAMGVFRAAGFSVVPLPVDYRTTRAPNFRIRLEAPLANLETFSLGLREWIGLLAYRLTGRTQVLLPG